MYRLIHWNPDFGKMNSTGFGIQLSLEWKEAVTKSGINQEKINNLIKLRREDWLKQHGMSDYGELRVHWGEWGPEHICVPGNACGLDITSNTHLDGHRELMPHNVDTIRQASLILTVFCAVETAIYYMCRE